MRFQRSSRQSSLPAQKTHLVSPVQIANRIVSLLRAARDKHYAERLKKLINLRQTVPYFLRKKDKEMAGYILLTYINIWNSAKTFQSE